MSLALILLLLSTTKEYILVRQENHYRNLISCFQTAAFLRIIFQCVLSKFKRGILQTGKLSKCFELRILRVNWLSAVF